MAVPVAPVVAGIINNPETSIFYLDQLSNGQTLGLITCNFNPPRVLNFANLGTADITLDYKYVDAQGNLLDGATSLHSSEQVTSTGRVSSLSPRSFVADPAKTYIISIS